jgi:hypothetical protein
MNMIRYGTIAIDMAPYSDVTANRGKDFAVEVWP